MERLLRKFKEYSGAELVFHREDLPEGRYHDVLKPLSDSRKAIAAAICVEEASMYTLQDAVSDYAAKNSREDQAETARHLMSMLPNSLVQTIDQPELAGSQRILHVLKEYEQAVPNGPGVD